MGVRDMPGNKVYQEASMSMDMNKCVGIKGEKKC